MRLALMLSMTCTAALSQSGPLTISGSKGDLTFGIGEMTDAKAEIYGQEADVTITLTAAAGTKLGDFTAIHAGLDITVLSCGKVIFRTRIIEPIRGGRLTIGGLTMDQAEVLADVLLGQATCLAGP